VGRDLRREGPITQLQFLVRTSVRRRRKTRGVLVEQEIRGSLGAETGQNWPRLAIWAGRATGRHKLGSAKGLNALRSRRSVRRKTDGLGLLEQHRGCAPGLASEPCASESSCRARWAFDTIIAQAAGWVAQCDSFAGPGVEGPETNPLPARVGISGAVSPTYFGRKRRHHMIPRGGIRGQPAGRGRAVGPAPVRSGAMSSRRS